MDKKCLICSADAQYMIKDSTDFYCKGCATDFFADLGMLLKVEKEAQKLKRYLNKKVTLDGDGQVVLHQESVNIKVTKEAAKKPSARKKSTKVGKSVKTDKSKEATKSKKTKSKNSKP